ncbi:hypothetical protein [Escherichia coli]|uniref:hypothetical protein n=1 Tax=Escherichia coli TaxID=562 RepID=UPI0020C34D04|nr:hypothetical protein [Escherichia coli]UTJ39590.1 hypothetical protein NLZ16_24935 [Escherichia coli]
MMVDVHFLLKSTQIWQGFTVTLKLPDLRGQWRACSVVGMMDESEVVDRKHY